MGSRYIPGLTALIVVLSLVSAAALAAEPAKKKAETPGYNDPSIGVLGAHRSTTEGGKPVNRNAAPPAPSAAPAVPKVEAEQPVVPGPGGGPVPLAAAPRPEAQVEGGAGATGQSTSSARAQPQQVNTFLASHPFVSGLIAGLIGTDLGSVIYGGPMMGDESAAMIGFLCRVALVVLLAVLGVRVIWGLIGGSSRGVDDYAPQGPRREPSFRRSDDEDGVRREPSLRAERPSYDDRRRRR
ncbi:hypothetical protein [Telmatospirillum siberiense]|uniref:Uncharacterized protein n=1 Tax=Telmatospirillum siberiense TaxID=382514 RepID=A0A2N3PWV8_9PROT|nr:hypothetical protein [Telmatospirillum siberiense]PKU24865.1 hypothetical protein CWS72_09830 [Telmatospirillum siberiense]